MNVKKITALILFCTVCSCHVVKADQTEKKIDRLVSRMTLQEKIGQMNQLNAGFSDQLQDNVRKGEVGTMLNGIDAVMINKLQRIAVTQTRLGIPLVFARDVIHGFKTIFPIPLGQSCSWNPLLVEQAAEIAAMEASSCGIRWTFAPMIDVSRDARWGRIAESCGEDSYLASLMGVAMIKGFQGDDLTSTSRMAACAKHFAAYGASESGRDYNTTWVPELQLREVYLPPFHAAAQAGVATVMCSFNDINGVPSSGNTFLNRSILRDEWHYKGVLVSDYTSIKEMIAHGFCGDLKDAAHKAALSGVDVDMMSYAYADHLYELVKSGAVSEKFINESVRNILRLKFRLGLFDNPYVDEVKAASPPFYLETSLHTAKQLALESAVLLKNNNSTLPLSENLRSITVAGPLADAPADQNGTWCFDGDPSHSVTPLAAMVKEYGSEIKIRNQKDLNKRILTRDEIDRVVADAKQSDVVLYFAGEEAGMTGEAHCRADISLPYNQSEVLDALKKTGKPLVLIVMSGRPLTIERETKLADAVLLSFHGGTMAGPALSDLIFGKASPSGRLTVTIPRMVGQLPLYYSHKSTGRPAPTVITDDQIEEVQSSLGSTSFFLDAGSLPLFPFGYGLSYTNFKYGDVKLSANILSEKGTLIATCNIANTGDYDAYETVQLYVQDKVGSLIRPVKELKGFEKIFLKAGQNRDVSFEIKPEELSFWNMDMKKRTEAGEFNLWIAPNSQLGDCVTFVYAD